jgi:hypothetical protein
MTWTPQMNSHYFVPIGQALLPLSFATSLVFALRDERDLEPCFISFAFGLLGLSFYTSAFDSACALGALLETDIRRLGNPDSLKNMVWESIQKAAGEADNSGHVPSVANIPAIMEQVFRTGVWGVASTVSDFFFLLAEAFVEIRRDVFLSLSKLAFPFLWGLFPLFPRLGLSLVALVIEMQFWGPCLVLIQLLISDLAPKYLYRPGSLGVPIVALEIVATLLILNVPRIVHTVARGGLTVGGESEALGLIFLGGRKVKVAAQVAAKAVSENGAASIAILLSIGLFSSTDANANDEVVQLYPGFVTQIHCKGKLLLSAVGNPKLVQREAFPKELGCGVVLLTQAHEGRTDLLLKSSSGDFHLILQINSNPAGVRPKDLEYYVERMPEGGGQ